MIGEVRTGISDYKPNMRESRINRVFSVFMALYPILCIYKAFSRFTIGDVILIAFCALALVQPVKMDKRMPMVFMFVFYAIFALCINMIFSRITTEYNSFSLWFRLIKFIFYMVCVFVCGKRYLNVKIFKKSMIFVAQMASLFMILQNILFYGANKIVLGQIPGLPLYLDEYAEINYNLIFSYNFRPSSFFLEPALFCHYMIVAVIIVLFDREIQSHYKRIFNIGLMTFSILLSTSGQGILYLIIVYSIYIFKGIKNKVRALGVMLFALLASYLLYLKVDAVNFAVNRLLFSNSASQARLGTYKHCFSLEGFAALFGVGYGATYNGEYMAGAAYIWYGCGILGLLLVICMFGSFYKNAKTQEAKVLSLIFFVMFFGTGLFYNYMVYWYFTLMLVIGSISVRGGQNYSEEFMK